MTENRRFWNIAWPLILSNITVPLLGLVDTAVLGHLDNPNYLAATAVGANLFTVIFWSFGFLKMATTGLTAQAFGNQFGVPRSVYINAAVIALFIALIQWIFQTPIISIGLDLMQINPELSPDANTYAEIRIWSAPAVLIHYITIGWLVGTQQTKAALITAIAVNLLNIFLDFLFVFGFQWQVAGVAWATTISEYFALLLGLYFVLRSPAWSKNKRSLAASFDTKTIIKTFQINIHLFIRTILLLFTFAFFISQSAGLGATVLATNAVLLTFILVISNALDGFANAAEALCGEALGEQNTARFHRVVKTGAVWTSGSAALLTALFYCFGSAIVAILTDIDDIRQQAQHYLMWVSLFPLLGFASYLFDGVFIGAAKAKAMQNTMLFSVVCVFLPVWYFSQALANHGLWLSMAAFLLARGFSQLIIYLYYTKRTVWLN